MHSDFIHSFIHSHSVVASYFSDGGWGLIRIFLVVLRLQTSAMAPRKRALESTPKAEPKKGAKTPKASAAKTEPKPKAAKKRKGEEKEIATPTPEEIDKNKQYWNTFRTDGSTAADKVNSAASTAVVPVLPAPDGEAKPPPQEAPAATTVEVKTEDNNPVEEAPADETKVKTEGDEDGKHGDDDEVISFLTLETGGPWCG